MKRTFKIVAIAVAVMGLTVACKQKAENATDSIVDSTPIEAVVEVADTVEAEEPVVEEPVKKTTKKTSTKKTDEPVKTQPIDTEKSGSNQGFSRQNPNSNTKEAKEGGKVANETQKTNEKGNAAGFRRN